MPLFKISKEKRVAKELDDLCQNYGYSMEELFKSLRYVIDEGKQFDDTIGVLDVENQAKFIEEVKDILNQGYFNFDGSNRFDLIGSYEVD